MSSKRFCCCRAIAKQIAGVELSSTFAMSDALAATHGRQKSSHFIMATCMEVSDWPILSDAKNQFSCSVSRRRSDNVHRSLQCWLRTWCALQKPMYPSPMMAKFGNLSCMMDIAVVISLISPVMAGYNFLQKPQDQS